MSDKRYRNPFFASIGVHAVIVLLLFIGLPVTKLTLSDSSPGLDQEQPVIEAKMVDQTELNNEIKRLAQEEANRKAQEKQRIEKLKQLEKQAELKRKQEEAKLQSLKAEQEALKQKAAEKLKAEQLELAKLKKAKEEALKVQQAAEQKAKEAQKQKLAAEAKAAEAARLKQEADKLAKAQAAEKQKQAAAEAAARQRQVMQDQISQYASMMMKKVTQNWRKPLGMEASALSCLIEVQLLPTGEVLEAHVVETSGSLEFDRSAELGVLKSSPFTMPPDDKARAEFRNFRFRFKPSEVG
ncbi:MAG: cell envelope integrity protein TolA [Gammaproteobacteria bacterium]